MRTDMRVSNWTCDRCGNIDQSQLALVAPITGLNREEGVEPIPRLPPGWARTTIHWDRGTSLAQDLCTTCADLVDGAMSRRYDVVDPAKDVEVKKKTAGRSNGHPPTKRAAKKTAKKAP